MMECAIGPYAYARFCFVSIIDDWTKVQLQPLRAGCYSPFRLIV